MKELYRAIVFESCRDLDGFDWWHTWQSIVINNPKDGIDLHIALGKLQIEIPYIKNETFIEHRLICSVCKEIK